ncbi:hypothetical protein BC941DRAFT_421515 [Chlamydoabsidia padenii]|nr:hypothetical protein BC941DRAFT_421515 [Chlamydoabsidia padenii]
MSKELTTTTTDEKKGLVDHYRLSINTTTTLNTTSSEQRSPPPAYQPIFTHHHSLTPPRSRYSHYIEPNTSGHFYQPTPPPQTVIVHDTPSRSKDACCWGCIAGLILCFGAKECLCF